MSIQVLLLFIQTYGVKSFKSMLPKCFSFLQLCMCFALLKNYKIPIFNAAMAIKTIVSVKQFLRNFPITFSKCSMFTFSFRLLPFQKPITSTLANTFLSSSLGVNNYMQFFHFSSNILKRWIIGSAECQFLLRHLSLFSLKEIIS